jgi:hypothetical protein
VELDVCPGYLERLILHWPHSAVWPVTRSAWRPWLSSVATRSCRVVCSSLARTLARQPGAPQMVCPLLSRSASVKLSGVLCEPR